jgi:hypothetical protein
MLRAALVEEWKKVPKEEIFCELYQEEKENLPRTNESMLSLQQQNPRQNRD